MVGIKTILFIALTLLIVSCAPQTADTSSDGTSDGTFLKASFDAAGISVGDEVVMDIIVENVESLYGFQLNLIYNPSTLEFVEIEEGDFLQQGSSTFPITPSAESGLISNIGYTRMGQVPGVSGTGTLVKVRFVAISSGKAEVSFSEFTLVNEDVEVISANSMADTVEVR